MACFKTEWALTGDLDLTNIQISTGWFDEAADKSLQVVISEDHSDDDVWELGYGTIKVRAIYQADVFVHVIEATASGRGKAKDNKFKMVKEIRRILKANKTGLTDLDEVELRERGRSLDELYRTPPILRYNLRFIVTYYE